MALNIFVDSCFIVSLINREETCYSRANKLLKVYQENQLYFNSLVEYESINVTLRKWGIKQGKRLINWFDKCNLIKIDLDKDIESLAYQNLTKKYSKNDPNVFDYIHFACMQKYGIQNVLTFDKHFGKIGFTILK